MGDENGSTLSAKENPLFDLECFLVAGDIQLCARSEIGRRQIIALVTGSNELILYYTVLEQPLPVVKQIPWLLDSNKNIVAICFDPSGTWLLVAGCDGSLYVVPALSLVDPSASLDHRWRAGDLTELPLTCGLTRPTPASVIWWHNLDGQHVAILGSAQGQICFVSLTSGADLGRTSISENISYMNLCQDNNLDSVFLLITSPDHTQWKLTLEQRSAGYCWPLERSALDMGLDADALPGTCLVPLPARSRLQGLKQLSVEKLATLKQKLAETRNKGGSLIKKDSSSEEMGMLRRIGSTLHENAESEGQGPSPERVTSDLGFFAPQYARGRYLLSAYYPGTQLLKILPVSMTDEPLFLHKLPPNCARLLYTDRFLFISDKEGQNLTILSSQLSEMRPDRDKEHNADAVIQIFELEGDERVVDVYKHTESNYYGTQREESRGGSEPREGQRKLQGVMTIPSGSDRASYSQGKSSEFSLPQSIKDIKIEAPQVDTCVVVTNKAVYEVKLRQAPAEVFMELALEKEELEKAEKLALLFGLNVRQLLEAAGDLKLAARQFPQAITLYKLSRCRHLKSVLKFAMSGHSAELLGYVEVLLTATDVDLSVSEKMHLSNLAMMSHVEQVLRHSGYKAKNLLKKFLYLLKNNLHYDETLAVNVSGQTGLWDVVLFLSSHRGLRPEVLDILLKIVASLNEASRRSSAIIKPISFHGSIEYGMWLCLSDPELLQALLLKPKACKAHMNFIGGMLPTLNTDILERFASLYNPSSPVLRMFLRKILSRRQRLYSSGSGGAFSHLESLDYSEPEENPVPVQEIIELFIFILLHLIRKQCMAPTYMPDLMEHIKLPSTDMDADGSIEVLPLQLKPVSAGFAHAGVIRNGALIMWGNAVQGCLGHGPSMNRYGTPQKMAFFPAMRIEVLSVACGKNHTLALTTNGVYSWGSSQFGQLGVGKTGQSPHPRMVETLATQRIVAISAGQYHSLALTEQGRVYSWGWGVHGQLGHHSVEDELYPTLIQRLCDKTIIQVCGGHGHTTVLASNGEVWGFGSGVFGQLGTSLVTKKTVPIQVTLPENIRLIAVSYFHNFAVGDSNSLYTWGSSYQVLRLQAQAQKRARLLQEQQLARPQSIARVSTNPRGGEVLSPDVPSPSTPEKNTPTAPPTSPSNPTRSMPIPVAVETVPSPAMEIPPSNVVPTQPPQGIMKSVDPVHLQNIEESIGQQTLFAPVRVDTSQVLGKILQLSCGYHHSALLTDDNLLFTWGRSLDGQLGNGARKEVPYPTPLLTLADRQIVHMDCGADFTVAMEKNGSIFIWGSNALGQLGSVPIEDSKSMESKYIKFKTTKRIVKLPHGKQNSCDLPGELPGLPSLGIPCTPASYANNMNWMGSSKCMFPLQTLEDPAFSHKTLHATLEQFYGHYDHNKILALATELENFQAAAKLASLERHYHLALAYQLKALSLGLNSQTSTTSSISTPEYPLTPEKQKTNGVPVKEKTDRTEIHSFAIQGGQEQMIDRFLAGENEDLQCSPVNEEVVSVPTSPVKCEEKNGQQEQNKQQNEFAVEASSIVEHYVSLMEAESHTMMRRLLEQGIEFWLSHSLPVDQLENLLMKHMSKFFYPLGLMLFCKGNGVEGEEAQAMQILSHLSTRFCLQLCKTLLSHINQKKVYPEYVELLAQVTSMHANSPPPPTTSSNGLVPPSSSSSVSPERLMEGVLENLTSSGGATSYITLHDVDTSPQQVGTEDLIFSCGHQYDSDSFRRSVLPELELGLLRLHRPLPTTARVLKGLFGEGPSVKLACPLCVLRHLQAQQSEDVSDTTNTNNNNSNNTN